MDIESKIIKACNMMPAAFAPAEKNADNLIVAINKWREHVLSNNVELKNNSEKFEDDAKSLRIERDALRAELQKARESSTVPAMPIPKQDDVPLFYGNTIAGDATVRINGVGEFICKSAHSDAIPKQEPVSQDREMLIALMSAFDTEHSICENCGHQEETMYMDSANMLRDYLQSNPVPTQAAAIPEKLTREQAIEKSKEYPAPKYEDRDYDKMAARCMHLERLLLGL